MKAFYHLMTPEDWETAAAAGHSTLSTRGLTLEKQGFVHNAFAHQVDAVANRFFGDCPRLVLLEIDPERVEPEIRVEPAADGTGDYPHIYGPLDLAAVVDRRELYPGTDGRYAVDLAAD